MLKTLILDGRMAKKFGRVHQFDVADLPEMLRAMCSQVRGFKRYLSEGHMHGIRFAFFNGKHNIGLDEFDMTNGSEVYRITAITEGSKRGGVLQIVIGAVALVAAFFTAGGSLVALGMSAAAAAATTTALTGLGLSMMLGGVVQLLTPQPKYNVGASSSTDNKPNYAFGAPVNTVAMGYPVPVLFGEREIGGAIISAGIFSSDQQ
ncbi:tail assembly protein [Enterobacter kobei]|uniref:Tail assembly protein n=2 Tax=Enterobacter kobei TaxID=208224 RepID=A0AA86IUD3_9ENTR|nr:tail assembly protein [Enterobacter kobei]OLR20723.1 phage tail protein [Enterobacter kobei]BCU55976.1 tail assembly protein [Enterobacter kobei]SIQ32237.1 Phage-related protein, tail component [Enterobacter kobei]